MKLTLLQGGSFELRKWSSNLPALRDNNFEHDKTIDAGSEHCNTCTLGMYRNCDRDTFYFANCNNHQPLRLTKRSTLSRIALIFDLLGFMGPVILIGKLIMQELWLLKIDWDESVPMDLDTRWRQYEQQLSYLVKFEIPCKIVEIVDETNFIELHGFADVNQHAYIYARHPTLEKLGFV